MNTTVPIVIDDSEKVARIIVNAANIIDGEISPMVFRLRPLEPPEWYVSVIREKYMEISEKSLKETVKAWKDKKLTGYLSLKTGECRKLKTEEVKVDIRSFPSKSNPAHAGIVYIRQENGEAIQHGEPVPFDFILLLEQLVKISTLYTF